MHTFEGREAPPRTSGSAQVEILRIKALDDFQARHHPAQWELVRTGGDDKKPVFEWLPIVRMHRIKAGVGGVWCDKNGKVDSKTLDASRGVWKRKGWLYLDEAMVGVYRREVGPCFAGRTHFCWAWISYRQLPGLNPESVRDLKREIGFRRNLIGRVVEGRRIELIESVRQGRIREAEQSLERVLQHKETPLATRERLRLEAHIAAMKTTPAPRVGSADAQAA
jgi:hypothetical protein